MICLKLFVTLNYIQLFLKESVDRTREEVIQFKQKAEILHSSLVDLDRKNATKWYLHILLFHVPDQILQEKNVAKYSCSAQERVNSQHYHQIQTSILLDATSEQLLKRKRLQATFDCHHVFGRLIINILFLYLLSSIHPLNIFRVVCSQQRCGEPHNQLKRLVGLNGTLHYLLLSSVSRSEAMCHTTVC